ncbi:hypothetical protein ISCGN_025132 [Ixodes scapularis]
MTLPSNDRGISFHLAAFLALTCVLNYSGQVAAAENPAEDRGKVLQGSFRPCSSHADCKPGECCIYSLSRGDSCVKLDKACPIVALPQHPHVRFCPPYNSGVFRHSVCTWPSHCPYPQLCCNVGGSRHCVDSFYDRRR